MISAYDLNSPELFLTAIPNLFNASSDFPASSAPSSPILKIRAIDPFIAVPASAIYYFRRYYTVTDYS